MSTTELQERIILTNKIGHMRIRVLKVFTIDTWIYDLNDPAAVPTKEFTEVLKALISEGDYLEAPVTASRTISPAMAAKATAIYSLMKPAFMETNSLFVPSGRMRWLRELQVANPSLKYKTYMKYLRMWFAGGCTEVNLLPNWDACGSHVGVDIEHAKQIHFQTAKKAVIEYALALEIHHVPAVSPLNDATRPDDVRKKGKKHAPFFIMSEETLAVFDHFYKWKKAKRGRTLQQAHTEMVGGVFSIVDPLGRLVAFDFQRIPHLDVFKYWWRQLYTFNQRRRADKGNRNVDLNERGLEGDEISTVPYAGAAGGLDATIWNIYIRSRFPGRKVIGPPVVFRARCKRSGMLLGLAVGLENASWMGAASAISNCLEDKVEFCKRYKVEISHAQWPIAGLPGEFEADRGETDNYGPEIFIEATSVQIRNTPSHRPDMRPGSESDFNTLQVKMNGMTPGALVDRWSERQGDDWKIETVMDIDQFTKYLILHELARMVTPRPELKMTSRMIDAGLDGSPLSIWNWSTQNEAGGLKKFNLKEVQLALLPRRSGTIRSEGVYFRGILYTSAKLMADDAFMRARIHGRKTEQIAFDPRLVDRVHIVDPTTPHAYFPCTINLNFESQQDFAGKTFSEVESLLNQKKENVKTYTEDNLKQALSHQFAAKAVLADASAMTAAAIPIGTSKTKQKKDIKLNRVAEKNVHSPTIAFNVARPTSSGKPIPINSTVTKMETKNIDVPNDEFLQMLNKFQPLK